MKTRIVTTMLLSLTILCCGKEKSLGFDTTDFAPKQLSKPTATKSQPKHWSAVSVTVSKNGQLLQGVDVKFSRSISGQPPDYQWEGEAIGYPAGHVSETDIYGWCEVFITSDPKRSFYKGASGYYSARVIDPETNVILDEWHSIPLEDGHLRTVFLEIGKPPRFASEKAEHDIRETVFRIDIDDDPPDYFLALSFGSVKLSNGEWISIDPPDTFLDRFQQDAVQVIKASQTEYRGVHAGFYHKETGEPGELISVSKLRWISDTDVIVQSSYGGGICYLLLTRSNGQWIIKETLAKLLA